MIRLYKNDMPEVLTKNYKLWTDDLLQEVEINGERIKSFEARYRHKTIKEAVKKETCGKCAYCESAVSAASFGDIEHIIPKSKVREKTFEWENLTFSCQKCNNKKLDYHSEEYPLINPYVQEPSNHIQYLGPVLFPKDCIGKLTVDKIELNRVELLENRKRRLEKLKNLKKIHDRAMDESLKKQLAKEMQSYTEPCEEYSFMFSEYLKVELRQI